jgi:hypothetical protein
MFRLPVYRLALPLGLVACLSACQNTSKKPSYPDDPLFVLKKPIEAKAAPSRAVHADLAVSPVPAVVLAGSRGDSGTPRRPEKKTFGEADFRPIAGSQ